MNGFGGIVSFEIKGNLSKAKSFLKKTKNIYIAESLGGLKVSSEHPAFDCMHLCLKEKRKIRDG